MIRPPAPRSRGLRPTRKPLACCVAASLALFAGGSAAQVDEVQLRLVTQFELPLRWDNVEPGRPYWTRGVRPAWRAAAGLHMLRLAPGESVTVRIPAGESLRVRALDDAAKQALAAADGALTVAFSNGTGLYAGRRPRRSADGLDWLVESEDAAPQASPQLARVSLAAAHGEALEVALFVSRREPLGRIAPYRRLHELPGDALDVQPQRSSRPLHYWAIEPAAPVALDIEGPARFALRVRLRYPANEAESAQHWRVAASLDDQPLATLTFATGAENSSTVAIDGRESVVSREKEGYFEVPEGRHRLTLASSAPVIARLLSQADPDYLVPALNAPETTAAEARTAIAQEPPLALRLSGWGDAGQDAAALVAARDRISPAAVQAAALQLARDNRHREGGAVGAAAMREIASLRRDDPTLRGEAGEYALHTYYRDLLPRDQRPPGALRHAWFLAPRLHADTGGEGEGRGTVLAGQHADELPGSLAAGRFLPLGDSDAADAYAYDLPERFAPSSLRVAVHGDDAVADTTVYVQYDDAAPVPLTLAPYPELPGAAFIPSGGEAALRLQQERFRDAPDNNGDNYGTGTLSGAFSRGHLPGPLVAARIAELSLPRSVRQVRLWRAGAGGQPMWIALAYRAAKPFQLTERAWLEAARTLRGGPVADAGAIAPFLAALGPATEFAAPPDAEADSHWQPLARLLRAQAAQFAIGVAPEAIATGRSVAPAAQSLREAEHLAARGQWLGALEAWSAALASPVAAEREQAFAGRIRALRHLGEDYIAERLLRQRMLHELDPAARRGAHDMLIALHRGAGDLDAEQATRAAALLREGLQQGERRAVELVSALATNLLDNGEPDLALMAGLLLPRRDRPLETMLRAAHAQHWWTVFDELVADLPDPARQAFWRAQRALGEGRIADAEADFARAGSEGAAFAAHLARARDIRKALRDDGPDEGARALADWADWQASHPGPRRWQDAIHLATDFAGAQALQSPDRDLGFTAFRAEPERPLRLRVAGPAKLRIEARPLHPAGSTARIDGWLRTRAEGREWLAPISSNAPAPALQLVGRPQTAAGRAVVQEIEIGPGWHDIATNGGERALLVRVAIEEAALPLPLLPRLTPDTAAARASGAGVELQDPLRWPAPCIDCSTLLDVHPGDGARRVRLARNLIDANPATLAEPALPPLPAAARAPESTVGDAALRAAGDWQALLAWPAERSDTALRARLTSLAWIAEHQPAQQRAALALAEDILHAHPAVPGLSALVARIARDAAWTPIDSVKASAGLRSREVAGWDPESPSLRVRRALLAPAGADERLLSGANRLVVSTNDPAPTRIEVVLSAEDAGALPPQAMTALLQIDEATPVPFVLEPGRTTGRRIALPAGAHTLRVWIAQPLADQFLRVRLFEPGHRSFADRTERFYHVATRAEPLRVAIDGPAWLRIDEWVDGRSESRYRRVESGWQEIVLPPAEGRAESLYRLHLRSLDPGRPRSEPRTYDAEPQPVPPPAVTIADRPLGTGIAFDDHFPLGGQEDGTWSLGVARRERLYGFEDSTGTTNRLPAGQRARVRIDRYFDWVDAALGGNPSSATSPPRTARVRVDRYFDWIYAALGKDPENAALNRNLRRILRRLGLQRAAGGEDAAEHERFTEFAATHRYFAESWNTHYRGDLLVREREGGGPTLGLRGAATTAPAWTRWNFHVEGSAFAQSPGNNDYLESSWGLRASATHLFAFTPRVTMQPRISLFWRGQSLGANRFFAAGRIDQDIYSPYRDHHPRGLEVAKTVTWRPWLDTELYAGAGVTTNPDMNPLKAPDHLAGRLGWRQLLGPLRFDANWDGRQYFEDSHRADDSTGGSLNLEVGWEHWLPRRERLELGFTLRRDLARDRNLFGLELTWHFGNGRGYRDFRPGEIDFRDLRERRAPQDHNNRMRDEP